MQAGIVKLYDCKARIDQPTELLAVFAHWPRFAYVSYVDLCAEYICGLIHRHLRVGAVSV